MSMSVGPIGQSDEPEVMMDINTTPLIDVMLVLLIMLIITIPIQLHAVNLDMPVRSPPTNNKPVVVRVDVDYNGTVFWNGQKLSSMSEVEARMKQAAATTPQPEMHIRAHGGSRYDATAAVLATAQRVGLKKLGIVGAEQFGD
jgi:biopolymer transport protein ExbD